MSTRTRDTRPATEGHKQAAANRAVEDPKRLAQAARIVRTALARQALKLADVLPEGGDGNAA